jgi:acetate kinase
MADAVLTINAGSSSIKFALYELENGLTRVADGLGEGIGETPHLRIEAGGAVVLDKTWPDHSPLDHETLLGEALDWVEHHLGEDSLVAAGHRIVHGGDLFLEPTRLTPQHLRDLARLNQLAPLHEPHNIAAVQAVFKLRPDLPQIGCFDTGFHRTMPEIARWLAIPRSYRRQGVRRYGFHGLSYEYIASRLPAVAPRLAQARVIVAHLGNGASMCALRAGQSIDSTMGFTALDGLMMGTRCGAIDPGVLLYLMQARGMTADDLSTLLYKRSGLLGVSGISSDVRTLLASPAPEAKEALDLFAFIAARQAAGLVASLGGLDGLVFTAGIGEHAPAIRAAICERLAWLGIKLSPEANATGDSAISEPESRVEVRIIPTDEDLMIATHTKELIGR